MLVLNGDSWCLFVDVWSSVVNVSVGWLLLVFDGYCQGLMVIGIQCLNVDGFIIGEC